MDTITKVSQLSFAQSFGSKSAFMIKLTDSSFDNVAGSKLLAKVESWITANALVNDKELPQLVVDMKNVEFIDSQGLHKLLAALKLMQSQNSSLLLCSTQPSVSLVFEITRFDQVFAIFPSLDAIVGSPAPHQAQSQYLLAA
jgi:anti-anti-sigma factor